MGGVCFWIKKVVSGGQTGVDQAALCAARDCGLPTGGWAADNFKTEKGFEVILLRDLGLWDSRQNYPRRTELNIQDSDGTLIIHDKYNDGRGTQLTASLCEHKGKPYTDVWLMPDFNEDDTVRRVIEWLHESDVHVLNVAGGRESKHPGIKDLAYAFLTKVFEEVKRNG